MLNAYFAYIYCTVISISCDHNTKPQSTVLVILLLMWVIITLSEQVSDAIVYPTISTEPHQPTHFNFHKREFGKKSVWWSNFFIFQNECGIAIVKMIVVSVHLWYQQVMDYNYVTQNGPECSLRSIRIQNFPEEHAPKCL